jgi:hypothetical protein
MLGRTINCPQCNAPLDVPAMLPAGKRLGCPDCGATFLPDAATAGQRTEAYGRRPRYDDDYDDPPPPRDRGSGSSVALLLGILVTLLLVGGITIVFVLSFTREAETASVVNAPSALPPGEMPGNNPPPNDAGRRGRGGATMRESPPRSTVKQGDSSRESPKADATPPTLLGEEVPVGAYRVRAPKDYVAEKVAPQEGKQVFRWKGPGAGTAFEVSLAPAPDEKNLEALLEKEIDSVAGWRGLGWGCSLAEPVMINGLKFVRASWSLQARPHRPAAAGVVYVAIDGDTLIRISARDPAPRPGGPGEAAPQTFRRATK